eukprot:TRINITY_DN10970_c0_g1_i4.p1 TRINITY_DN10970_c0_g1~~TRINITY_DN10970_c0_g1_i4.p1  ORF type:complete len:135 (-),score=19.71 TRINITY_DN10970_c0_g1_i4:178-582(-)
MCCHSIFANLANQAHVGRITKSPVDLLAAILLLRLADTEIGGIDANDDAVAQRSSEHGRHAFMTPQLKHRVAASYQSSQQPPVARLAAGHSHLRLQPGLVALLQLRHVRLLRARRLGCTSLLVACFSSSSCIGG